MTQALDTLVSFFRAAEKEWHHAYCNLPSKRLVLGILVGRPNGAINTWLEIS